MTHRQQTHAAQQIDLTVTHIVGLGIYFFNVFIIACLCEMIVIKI